MSKSEIRFNETRPELYIDGDRVTPVIYALSDFPAAGADTAYAQRNIKRFAEAGINLVNIDIELHIGWKRVTSFEPDSMLSEIANVLDTNPRAKVNMRLHINPPYWWMRDNPDELAVYRMPDGDIHGIDDGEPDRLIGHDGDNHIRVSLASEKWLAETGKVLSVLLDHFNDNKEGDAIFGIQIACGLYGEWHKWGRGEDVSPVMQRRFSRFLREKYGTEEALRRAWCCDTVTFDTAEYHPERFAPGDDGIFRDPKKSRCNTDSVECAQTVPADAILYFSKIVKEKMPNVLTGAFFGYYLGTGGDHLQVKRVYESGLVDFLCAPFPYMENRDKYGVPMQRGLLESTRLNKMLWLTEMDQHPYGSKLIGGGNPEEFPESIATLRRNVIQVLATGHGLWYFDHRVIPVNLAMGEKRTYKNCGGVYRKRGWWEEPELMAEIEGLQRLAEKMNSEKYTPVADVLLVYDTSSFYYRADFRDPNYKLYEAVARCGVSIDTIYADDLDKAELERYKCVIFTNSYMITPERREEYKKRLWNTVTVWLGAQGYCDGEVLSEGNLSKTIGINLQKTDEIFENQVLLGVGILSGAEHICPVKKPIFKVCDESAAPLLLYPDGTVGGAKRENNIWLASNDINRDEMFKILKYAGAHIFCESGDPVLACGSFVAINVPKGGKKRITLRNGRSFEYDFSDFSTIAFDSETGEKIL